MSASDGNYKIGMKLRVSRLVVGLMSLALVLSVQFMVVAGVAGDHVYVDWQIVDEVDRIADAGIVIKVVMVLLLISGLALVTLGAESLIDKLPSFTASPEKKKDRKKIMKEDARFESFKPRKAASTKSQRRHTVAG